MRSPNSSPGVLVTEDWQAGGFGIYIHWPFCQSKCPYCDFNSHVRDAVDHTRWARALAQEIDNAARMVPERAVNSVFFGGGTPSLMEPSTVEAVLDAIRRNWTVSNRLEVTLEANPTSVEAGKLRDFAAAGINRISMGIQSLKDSDLKRLGRLHTAAEARKAFDIARDFFGRVSFDLIYARQHQTSADWAEELTEATSMAVDHLSLYQLTIESGTRFGDLYKMNRLLGLPSGEIGADMYDMTQEICDRAGLYSYETSNHARRGAESQHNLIYWRYGDYVGVGPGAHGRLSTPNGRLATVSASSPENWLNTVEKQGTGATISENISRPDQATEYLMMSLRLSEGSDLERYNTLSGARLPEDKTDEMIDQGLLNRSGNRIIAVGRGKILLNSVLRELLI
jgi:oxygen-independent coproporphyrinogen-3 oxidase